LRIAIEAARLVRPIDRRLELDAASNDRLDRFDSQRPPGSIEDLDRDLAKSALAFM
jgi:hypothetical protein